MTLTALDPDRTAAIRRKYGARLSVHERAARKLEAELYNLADLLEEQLQPPPDPPVTRATGRWFSETEEA